MLPRRTLISAAALAAALTIPSGAFAAATKQPNPKPFPYKQCSTEKAGATGCFSGFQNVKVHGHGTFKLLDTSTSTSKTTFLDANSGIKPDANGDYNPKVNPPAFAEQTVNAYVMKLQPRVVRGREVVRVPKLKLLPQAGAAQSDALSLVNGSGHVVQKLKQLQSASISEPQGSVTKLSFPNYIDDVAVGANGVLYADSMTGNLYQLAPGGTINSLATHGLDGPVDRSNADTIGNIAVDASGNIFIANESFVDRLNADGSGTLLVGDPTPASANANGTVNSNPLEFTPPTDIPGTQQPLEAPSGLVTDGSDDLFVLDGALMGSVLEIRPDGTITTVLNNTTSTATLHNPGDLALDNSGHLYISDTGNNRVVMYNLATGALTAVAGNGTAGYSGDGGPATNAELKYPAGLALDSAGDLFIADSGNKVIRELHTNGTITTVPGSDKTRPEFSLAVSPAGDLYSLAFNSSDVYEFAGVAAR